MVYGVVYVYVDCADDVAVDIDDDACVYDDGDVYTDVDVVSDVCVDVDVEVE